MFGNSSSNGNAGTAPGGNRPPAAEVARIEGNLTHILVSSDSADGVQVFLNGKPVPAGEIESLSVNIVAPGDGNASGTITGIISRYQTAADGTRSQRGASLFPGTIEVIARGRRIVVTCAREGSFDGLWLGLGMQIDGTSSELNGVQSLRVVVSSGIVDAKLVWGDGSGDEDLLPED